jgi:hypothetical protein
LRGRRFGYPDIGDIRRSRLDVDLDFADASLPATVPEILLRAGFKR